MFGNGRPAALLPSPARLTPPLLLLLRLRRRLLLHVSLPLCSG